MKKKFYLGDGYIGGVCAGVAEYYDIEVTFVRVLWGLLSLCFIVPVIIYLLIWLTAPEL